MQHEKIVGVQYLRAIAAIAVVLQHASSLRGHVFPRLEFGWLGVDLFFLISGFVIAAVSLSGPDLAPAVTVRDFLTRRFIRIVPLMWVTAAVFAFACAVGIRPWPPVSYFTGAVLWPFSLKIAPASFWTLRLEAVFYIVFAITMLGGRRWRFLLILWVVSPVLVWLTGRGTGVPWSFIVNPANWEFGAGLAAAFLWMRYTQGRQIRLPVDPLPVLALIMGALIWGIVPETSLEAGLAIAILFLPVLLLAIHAECPPGPWRTAGEFLGNASYSIYLFHPLGVIMAQRLVRTFLPTLPMTLAVAIAALSGLALGIAAHLWVERPLLAWLRRRTA